ncbi:membrane protease subunit, partial [Streptomyces sp. SID9727]|nr:membrane protease subunit [Streptomyces sp. SID9727]
MRSTVSDSSGNPENGQETEYGTVPVREWVGPGGAGSVTDAWAAGATADALPVAEGLPVRGTSPGGPRTPEPPPLFGPVSVSVPSDDEVVVQVAEPPAPERGGDADSVVDLVLDLRPGKEDRGAALGATSASVSVPAGTRARAEEPADAVPAGTRARAEEPADAVPVDARPVDAPVPDLVKDAGPVDAVAGATGPEDAVPVAKAPRSECEPEPVLALAGARVPGPDA